MKVFLYQEVPTNLWGLTFVPNIEGVHPTPTPGEFANNGADWVEYGFLNDQLTSMQFIHFAPDGGPRNEFTDANKEVLSDVLDQLMGDTEQIDILEVGVGRSGVQSSTERIVTKKRQGDRYLGVDINRVSLIPYSNSDKNEFTICTDSSDMDNILKYAKTVGITEFDFIFLDGHHSINQVILEWRFTCLLKIGGYVGFHDTNYHPGPYCVFEAIDENLFEKTKYCVDIPCDPGIAFVKRVK